MAAVSDNDVIWYSLTEIGQIWTEWACWKKHVWGIINIDRMHASVPAQIQLTIIDVAEAHVSGRTGLVSN